MSLLTSKEEPKKVVEDYDPTVEEYNESYEVIKEATGQVTAVFEDKVVIAVSYSNKKAEIKYYSTEIPFIFSLKKGDKIKIMEYFNYDMYTEMYEMIEEVKEEIEETTTKIQKDLVSMC